MKFSTIIWFDKTQVFIVMQKETQVFWEFLSFTSSHTKRMNEYG